MNPDPKTRTAAFSQVDQAETASADHTREAGRPAAIDAASIAFLAAPQLPDEIGRLGPYRVLAVLGKGGMGMVFRAEDPALRRQVALKVMLPKFAADQHAH